MIAQVNAIVDALPRVDIPAGWVDFVVKRPQPHFIGPLFTRDPAQISEIQVLMAMMAIRGLYAEYGVHRLNHGIVRVHVVRRSPATAGAAFGMALTVVLSTVIVPQFDAQWATPSLEDELVGDHVRSMGMGPLIEVASSDRHTVKPWFQGKLDCAPPVPDVSAEGFPLLGGRVERVGGKAVAALAYARDRHIINVFVWPAGRPQAPQVAVHKGLNLQHWSDGAMQVWVVSDAEAGEVEHFSAAWLGQVVSAEKAER